MLSGFKKLFLITLTLAFQNYCSAQFGVLFNKSINKEGIYKPKLFRYSSLSLGIGSSHFLGDISPQNPIKALTTSVGWNITASYSYTLSNNIHFGANLQYIRLAGDDNYSDNDLDYIRNLHFRNDIKEVSFFFQYHPTYYSTDFRKRTTFSPYITFGIGYFLHNPEARLPIDLGSKWVELQPVHTEGQGLNSIYAAPYKLSGFSLPLGLGIRYKYSKKIDLSLEMTYNITFTDYLDDVSGFYPNPLLFNEKEAISLSNRSREYVAANTGQNRIEKLKSYLNERGLPSVEPFTFNDPAFGAIGSERGSKIGNDNYITTSLKIHFLVPFFTVKCPD